MNRRLLALIWLFLVSLPTLAADSSVVIEEITFTGLKRTRETTVRAIISPVAEGELFSDETEEQIIQELREAGIFNPEIEVVTRIEAGAAFIEVYVEDKWTLFPIPIMSYSGTDSWMAGIVGVESNFLGMQKVLGLGLFTGSDRSSFTGFYTDPRFLGSEIGLRIGIGAGRGTAGDLDVKEKTVREYENEGSRFSLGIMRPFGDSLSLSLEAGYETLSVVNRDSALAPADDTKAFTLSAGGEWKNLIYDIPYTRGVEIQAAYDRALGIDGTRDFSKAEGEIGYGFYPWSSHLLRLDLQAGWGDMPAGSQFRLGGRSGSATLPMGKVAAEEYLNSSVAYNLPLKRFAAATLSGKGFFEAGLFASDLIDPTLYYGPGFGFELFLNKIALPALGFSVGWNLETGLPQVSFSMGIGG